MAKVPYARNLIKAGALDDEGTNVRHVFKPGERITGISIEVVQDLIKLGAVELRDASSTSEELEGVETAETPATQAPSSTSDQE